MRSPYDYIGTNAAGHKVARTDLMLLDALAHCSSAITTAAIVEIADPRGLAQLTSRDAIRLLTFMLADGYVERHGGFTSDSQRISLAWQITEKGRAHLIAEEARDIFNECARHTPVGRDRRCSDKPRIEEAPEPIRTEAGAALHEQLKAAHTRLDELGVVSVSACHPGEPEAPATALLCVDEDELDEWWESLDVEMKADAFAQFALNMHHGFDSHVHVEPTDRVPLAGTVGDLSPELVREIQRGGTISTFHVSPGDLTPERAAEFLKKHKDAIRSALNEAINENPGSVA